MDSSRLPEQDFGHHALVLVLQEVTVKHRDATDDWVSKIHDRLNESVGRNVGRVQPFCRCELLPVLLI